MPARGRFWASSSPSCNPLLLPLFFAQTGLNTRVDTLSGPEWLLCLISQSLYAILVIVAIATTMMTGPLLGVIDRFYKLVPQSFR